MAIPQTPASPAPASLAHKALAVCCALLLVVSLLPLYGISLFNHPYYDDFGFSARVHAVWQKTHSLPQVLETAVTSARETRDTWQGTYTGTFLSNLQPGVFSEGYYFLTTVLLLSAYLLCFGYFFKAVFGTLLGLSPADTVTLTSLLLLLLCQFLPDPGEAFFWFNGGIGNTFIYSLLALSLGLCVTLFKGKNRRGKVLILAALPMLMILLGGGSYGGGIFGLLCYGLLTLWTFLRRRRLKWHFAALTLLFLACFLYSVAAPGNGVRASVMGYRVSPLAAVWQSLTYGTALAGSYVRLPLLAVTLLLLPCFLTAAQRLAFRFPHPWLFILGGLCLYCAQFAPPLYAMGSIGGGRIEDTYYQSFVVLWFLGVFYLAGHLVQGRLAQGLTLPTLPTMASRRWLIPCLCLFLVGCMAFQRPQDATYGLRNTAGGSALRSLLTGEAQRYHQEMKAREALLNDPSLSQVTLAPLTAVPEVFMEDLLVPGAPYNVRDSLCSYYGKTDIHLDLGSPGASPIFMRK